MVKKSETLKVGLVGAGGISGAHISVWEAQEKTDLVALCDIRREYLDRYPDKHLYTDFDQMLDEEALDVLDICLPTYLHADFAVKAMEHGIHVICEKPLSLKEADVERVYSTARANNVKFMVAQVLRFWPEYELVKSIFDSGKYGKLLSGYMTRLGSIPAWSWDGWMTDEARSGLVPFDLHIHDLDFLVYAFGTPTNVQSHRSKRADQDYLQVIYEYPDFFLTTEASWYAAGYPFCAAFRFQFEKAVLTFEKEQCILYGTNGEIHNLTQNQEGYTGSINLPKSDAYANEICYFTDCILEDRFPDKVKPEELETVIRLLKSI